jgi:acetyl-CoA synthetase
MKDGIAMLAGIDAGLAGIQAAVDIGAAWSQPSCSPLLAGFQQRDESSTRVLNEADSKDLLARFDVPVPSRRVVHSAEGAVSAAEELGYPIVVKALGVTHKTEIGGVRLNLTNAEEVSAAVKGVADHSKSYLIEKMVDGVLAELIVGVARDEQFGPYLLVGGGGILVELMKDSVSLLLPVTKEQVIKALDQLKCAPLFKGFRGAPAADLSAAVDVVLAVARIVEDNPSSIIELDINPLMLLPKGQGVVAVDALIVLDAESVLIQ